MGFFNFSDRNTTKFFNIFSSQILLIRSDRVVAGYAQVPLLSPNVDLNVPIEIAFNQPTLVCQRTPIGWRTGILEKGGPVFARLYARLLVHCMDWASHLPELSDLSADDRVGGWITQKKKAAFLVPTKWKRVLKKMREITIFLMIFSFSLIFHLGKFGELLIVSYFPILVIFHTINYFPWTQCAKVE